VTTRRRRTAEESRALILETAAQRLHDHGLEGLNITGVAEDAGLSHATLIHHFGSSGEMRAALVEKMTQDLVTDLMAAFDAKTPAPDITHNVFRALTEGGHAKLLAWRAVEDESRPRDMERTKQLFAALLARTQAALGIDTEQNMQRIILLVATAAIGFGLAGGVLADLVGMSEEDVEDFPRWVTAHIS
jgi:AcrR family transcriptional regulator